MNQRFQEIMTQAMELVDPYALEGEFGTMQLNAEKFAQLIVRECAEVVDNDDSSYPYDSFGHKLKQHFGVRE